MLKPPPLLKGYDFSEEEVREALSEDRLLLLIIFTTKRCNLKCPYCFTSSWFEDKSKLLSLEEYKDIILQAKELGARSIWWVGVGEPFLYEHWRELIDFSSEHGIWVVIYTNGTLITKEVAEFINQRKVSLFVKMNSFKPEIQDALAGRKGAYEMIQAGIRNLLEIGFNKDNRLGIETVITKLNYDEIPAIFRWARRHGIIPFIEMMEHANEKAKELDVTLEEHRSLFYKLLEIDQREFGYTWVPTPPWVAYRCRNFYISIAVDNEGYVQPCSGLHLRLGNIREKPLRYWWNHESFRKFRDPSVMEPEGCSSLGNYGCKSHAFHVTGDPFGEDPRVRFFRHG